jgi:predicted DsbA family dithiol-disulfide isomerase
MTETATKTKTIQIDVWSDVMCPFCYMGDKLLDQALAGFEHRDQVSVTYHSFLLMPELPVDETISIVDLFTKYKNTPREQTQQFNQRLQQQASSLGLDYNFDKALSTNMRKAHELIHFAKSQGLQHEMVTRLFKAYFSEGLNVGDLSTLANLAAEIGLDRQQAISVLESGQFTGDVDEDLQMAAQLGIQSVPFFVFNMKYAVSGAQPVESFSQVLQKVWQESE